MDTFAKRLKYAMDETDMNQAGLAAKTGAPRSAISQYLSGRNIPGPERMRALADATGVSLEFLSGAEPPPATAELAPIGKINVPTAAKCIRKGAQFVRVGLQNGKLPFGTAFPVTGDRCSYYFCEKS